MLDACDEASRLDEAADCRRRNRGQISQQRVKALLGLGDLAGADAEVARLAKEGSWYRFARINLAAYEVSKALLTGRFDDAERRIAEAQALASRSRDPGRANELAAQTYMLRREQGRLSELEAGVRAAVEQYPGMPVWRCALAGLFAELRRTEEARREFESLAASDFAVLSSANPRDLLLALVLLAEVCVFLEDRRRAALLYELLRPHAGLNVVVGVVGYFGAVGRPLGSLAGLLGRFEEAEHHFEEALEMHRRMDARPWRARTQDEFARMLLARGQARDRDRARELTGEALATARELGMVTLAERAQALHQEIQGAIPLRPRRRSAT
jgi:tetratricopeptide (TPR) repeat protein